MLELLFCLSGWLSPTQQVSVTGDIAFYPPGLMPQVAETRGLNLAGYAGGIATMSCGDRGREVWLEANGEVIGPLLVVDCSQRDHYQMNVSRGRIGDISRRLWERLKLPDRPFPARLWFVRPFQWAHVPT